MDEIILQVENNQVFTTSRDVAEKFNKRHDKLKTEIERMYGDYIGIAQNGGHPTLFIPHEYIHSQNHQRYTEYFLTRDGFSLLVMGFTGKEALAWKLKYIEAFNRMEETIHSKGLIQDKRLEIANMILNAPDNKVRYIIDLYPEYFSHTPDVNSLEYVSDLNMTYRRWIEDSGINKEFICDFPTTEIYFNYLRYCNDNRLISMGKKTFYKIVAMDFGLVKKQKANGYRYFSIA